MSDVETVIAELQRYANPPIAIRAAIDLLTSQRQEIAVLAGKAAAWDEIDRRSDEAHDYGQKHLMPKAWGANVWHAILDDAILQRQEIAQLREALAAKEEAAINFGAGEMAKQIRSCIMEPGPQFCDTSDGQSDANWIIGHVAQLTQERDELREQMVTRCTSCGAFLQGVAADCGHMVTVTGADGEPEPARCGPVIVQTADDLAAAYVRAEAADQLARQTWQPIASAPEAKHVMVWLPNYGPMRALRTERVWWPCGGGGRIYPSHWQPDLPSPPVDPAREDRP